MFRRRSERSLSVTRKNEETDLISFRLDTLKIEHFPHKAKVKRRSEEEQPIEESF